MDKLQINVKDCQIIAEMAVVKYREMGTLPENRQALQAYLILNAFSDFLQTKKQEPTFKVIDLDYRKECSSLDEY
jgi:hypothetical protein